MNKRSGWLLAVVNHLTTWAAEHGVKEVSPDRFHLKSGEIASA
jgi:hypothetical protein